MANPYAMMPQPPPPPPPPVPPPENSLSPFGYREIQKSILNDAYAVSFNQYRTKCRQKEMQFHMIGAIEAGNLPMVQKLVTNGVNMDCIIQLVKTPLILSMDQGQEEIASYLITAGANTNKPERNAWFRHPIHTAVFKNMYNIVMKLIVHGATIEAQDGNGMTPLVYSAIYGHAEIAKLLVSYGANLNCEDFVKRTALHFAAERNFLEIVDSLLSLGADINHKDKYGWTPLFGAIMYNHLEMVQLLLSRRASVHTVDYTGDTPMHLACSRFRREKVYVVLSTSEDVYKRKRRIPTLSFQNLCVKFRGSNINVVHCLIDAGVDVRICNNNGLASLDLCKEQNVMQCLVSVGGLIDSEWIESIALCPDNGENAEILAWITEQFKQQHKLLVTCKVAIRRYLSFTGSISAAIHKLPLPNPMKDFLDLVY